MTDDERAERIARARSSAEAKAEEIRSAWQAYAELCNLAARLKMDAAVAEDDAADYYAVWDYLLNVRVTRGVAPDAPADTAPAEGGARRPGRQGRRRKSAEETAGEPGERGAG